VALATAVFVVLIAAGAHAQMGAERFHAELQAGQSKKGVSVVWGYLYNDGKGGVANPRFLVETLDAQGQVIGQAQGQALGNMVARDRLYFEVPIQTTGASYRVRVLSWDSFSTGQ
jgi:hypothetical protein